MRKFFATTAATTEALPLVVFVGATCGLSGYCMQQHLSKNLDVGVANKTEYAFDKANAPQGLEAHNSFFKSFRGGPIQVFQGLNEAMSRP